jgi:hypothetical protein
MNLSPNLALAFQKQLAALGQGASNAVSGLYNGFSQGMHDVGGTKPIKAGLSGLGINNDWLPATPGVGEMVGNAVGAAGRSIGGLVGEIGNPIANAFQGKPLLQNQLQAINDTAEATGQFGQQIGEAGAVQAPLGGAGKIIRGAMAVPPMMNVVNDVKSGNVGLGTGLNAGAAAMGLYGAATDPNWTPGGVFDPQLKALGEQLGIPGGMTMHKATYQMLAQAIRDAQENGTVPPEETQAFLKMLYPKLASDNANFDSSRFDAAVNEGVLTNRSGHPPSMSKADYELIAQAFKDARDTGTVSPQSLGQIYRAMQGGFSQANGNYNPTKFMEKAGLKMGDMQNGIEGPVNVSDLGSMKPDNAYAARELASSLGLNEKFLLKNANQNGINLQDYLNKLDSLGEGVNKLAFSNDLMDKLASNGVYGADGGWSIDQAKPLDALASRYAKQDAELTAGGYTPSQAARMNGYEKDAALQSWANQEAGPKPGPWTDAFSRPMKTGMQWGDAGTATADSVSPEAQAGLDAGKYGALSVPVLTPQQQAAVTRLLRQLGTLGKGTTK